MELRSEVIPAWVDRYVGELLSWQPTMVGFTCMFDQTIASVAIAKRFRDLSANEKPLIVLGGYAVRMPTGRAVLETFPWIDAVCLGEGEPAIVGLAITSVERDHDLSAVRNLIWRARDGSLQDTGQAPLVRMDDVPDRSFDDFYSDMKLMSDRTQVTVPIDRLPVENSRGCWWGTRHHCVFCGIEDTDLGYRSRSAERVLQSLDHLSERYHTSGFRFADYILPAEYYRTLLPELARRGAPSSSRGS